MSRFVLLSVLFALEGCLDWAPPETAVDSDGEPPSIIGVEGTGPAEAISPRPEDVSIWEARAAERIPAEHRISSTDPVLVVSGSGLEGATEARAEGQEHQGTIEFEIEEASMNAIQLRFPPALSIAGGLFLLTVTTPLG